jgi:hypothetical protein
MCAAETGNPKLTMEAPARQARAGVACVHVMVRNQAGCGAHRALISTPNTVAATLAKQGGEQVEGRQRGAVDLAL